MNRQGKGGRSGRKRAASAVVRQPKARRPKKAAVAATRRWVVPTIAAVMAAPQIMGGPIAFFAEPPLD